MLTLNPKSLFLSYQPNIIISLDINIVIKTKIVYVFYWSRLSKQYFVKKCFKSRWNLILNFRPAVEWKKSVKIKLHICKDLIYFKRQGLVRTKSLEAFADGIYLCVILTDGTWNDHLNSSHVSDWQYWWRSNKTNLPGY